MPASAAVPTKLWRSKLRRLQSLTSWRHAEAAGSEGARGKAVSCRTPSRARGPAHAKRGRRTSARASRRKATTAILPASRTVWPPARPARAGRARKAEASARKSKRPAATTAEASARESKRPAAEAKEASAREPKRPAAEAKEVSARESKRLAAEAKEVSARESKRSAAEAKEASAHKPVRPAAAEEEAPTAAPAKRAKVASEEAPTSAPAKRAKVANEEASTTAPAPAKRTKAAKEAPAEEEAAAPAPAAEEAPAPEREVVEVRVRRQAGGGITLALALTAADLKKRTGPVLTPRLPPRSQAAEPGDAKLEPQLPPAPPPEKLAPPRSKADPAKEIPRILNAQSPEELLEVDPSAGEEAVTKAWKRLVLLLHPDKLHGLDEETRQAGQEALNFVHLAREELRRQTQEQCAEVPADPEPAGPPRLLEATSGARKYEVSWRLPETQDPQRPVEKYEIWGPRYFSEAGEPFDPVLLATLPPLQSHFVLVEEAPTQQDVMWAADRVLRPTLPLTVHAANGKGSSGPLTFEMAWASVFPWLQGSTSVLCPQCLRLNARRQTWTRCGGCGYNVPPEAGIIVRCPECNGEALWNKANQLNCSCCLLRIGQANDQPQHHHHQPWRQQRPPPPRGYAPPNSANGRGGRHY